MAHAFRFPFFDSSFIRRYVECLLCVFFYMFYRYHITAIAPIPIQYPTSTTFLHVTTERDMPTKRIPEKDEINVYQENVKSE